MIFLDKIALTQRHRGAPQVAGMRILKYRMPGDQERDGSTCVEENCFADRAFPAWIQGSHETRLQLLSAEDGFIGLRGNPGRFGRPDNVFNLDLDATVQRSNEIIATRGLPAFTPGDPYAPPNCESPEIRYTGARIWEMHLTQNYLTGSAGNAEAVLDWLDTQSISRVKKSRLGKSTVVWGSLNYCQVEAYLKGPEMLAHTPVADREDLQKSDIYQWAMDNGVVRIEVKAAKEYLKHKQLTYLGAWNMGTVHSIYKDRTEVLNRCKLDVEAFDIRALPSKSQLIAAAWMAGEDVTTLASRTTLWRHAKLLLDYGIDITQRRNIVKFPIRVRTIDIQPASMPDWYTLQAAA